MKKRQFVNFILLCIVLICFIFVLTGCSKEDKALINKAEQEIGQLEDKMVAMMNNLNKISFSNFVLVEQKVEGDNKSSSESNTQKQSSNKEEGNSSNSSSSSGQGEEKPNSKESTKFELKNSGVLINENQEIDWDSIKINAELIYATWPTVVVDLHELNVKNEDILNFSSVLDQVTLSIKEENKTTTLNNLASLYALLPNYRSQISNDNKRINIDYAKACVLNSYALVEQNKWDEMRVQLQNAIQYFSNVMNSIENNKQSQSRISKIYILLNELNNSIDVKDKELYYIKYRNVMQELINF